MKIELLYTADCAHYVTARKLLNEVVAEEKIATTIEEIRVMNEQDARRLEFLGSPSIRVEGMDVESFSTQPRKSSLRCRLYRENGSAFGYPPKNMIRSTILAVQDVEEFGAVGCC
ncbi:MAG: DUF2703 domain-containing protein [Chloroflexi bacterium]|nr:DUF2703 domain-containing protein [Chloroflexota bacterium]